MFYTLIFGWRVTLSQLIVVAFVSVLLLQGCGGGGGSSSSSTVPTSEADTIIEENFALIIGNSLSRPTLEYDKSNLAVIAFSTKDRTGNIVPNREKRQYRFKYLDADLDRDFAFYKADDKNNDNTQGTVRDFAFYEVDDKNNDKPQGHGLVFDHGLFLNFEGAISSDENITSTSGFGGGFGRYLTFSATDKPEGTFIFGGSVQSHSTGYSFTSAQKGFKEPYIQNIVSSMHSAPVPNDNITFTMKLTFSNDPASSVKPLKGKLEIRTAGARRVLGFNDIPEKTINFATEENIVFTYGYEDIGANLQVYFTDANLSVGLFGTSIATNAWLAGSYKFENVTGDRAFVWGVFVLEQQPPSQ